MKCIVVDLELNQPSNKIIQIGAVLLNARSGKIIDYFSVFVNPEELLSDFIVKLTGITQQQVDSGMSIHEGLSVFWDFVRLNTPTLVAAWGSDVRFLRRESANIGLSSLPKKIRELDIKAMFQVIKCGFPSRKVRGGLADTLHMFGFEFDGRPHNALDDARNTSKLLNYAVNLQYSMQLIQKTVGGQHRTNTSKVDKSDKEQQKSHSRGIPSCS